MKKKKSAYMKKREIEKEKILLIAYDESIEMKKQYIKEITEKLIKNKIHVGNMTFKKLETLQKKNRLIQFSISDMIGIEKVTIKKYDKNTKKEIESQNFLSFKEKMQEYILNCIDTNKSFKINFHLLNLKNYKDIYNNRDSFASDYSQSPRSRILTPISKTPKKNSFNLSENPKKDSKTEQKYIKLLKTQIKKKKLLLSLKKNLKTSKIPGPLKHEFYKKVITDYNSIDKNFYNHYKTLDPRMPKYMTHQIHLNTRTIFCSFNYFNTKTETEISSLLKLFYNYRSDIGYKQGMEIYALILAQNLTKFPLLQIFCFLLLDVDLIFAVFKGDQNLLFFYQRKVYDCFYLCEEDKMRHFVVFYKELVMQFFAYSVSVFFSYCFGIEGLKALMDLVVVFKGELFVRVFEVVFRFVEREDIRVVKNCFELARIVGKRVKFRKEDFVMREVRKFKFGDC